MLSLCLKISFLFVWASGIIAMPRRLDTSMCSNFNETELAGLNVLYSSLNGEHWVYPQNSTAWNFSSVTSNNPCTDGWAFLGCYYEDTFCWIESIEIMDVIGLVGTLPDVFNSFQKLSILKFVGNDFLNGSIPASIQQLTNLSSLSLWGNSLSGTLPPFLFNLPRLINCDVGNNLLTGVIPFVSDTSRLLEELSLSYNYLTGNIPPTIFNLTNLTMLNMSNNYLEGTISPSLCHLAHLEVFDVRSNQIQGVLPSCLGMMQRFQNLVASFNALTGSIPSTFGLLTDMQYLNLSGNMLTGSIPHWLYQPNLVAIDWSSNLLDGGIPESLSNLTMLSVLKLDHNVLTGSIPSKIGRLTFLNRLYLSMNSLSGPIPTELGECNRMEQLFLGGNFLSSSLPAQLTNMTQLVILDVHNNSLTGSIPPEYGYFYSMDSFIVYDNWLTGTIPTTFNNLQLVQFAVGNNLFSGPLPPLLNSRDIEYYTLYFNMFTGRIDPSTPPRLNLEIFAANQNELTGSIVNSYAAPSLINVYIQHNSFSGPLPHRFSTSIASIQAAYNFFTGSIHSDFANLPSLNQLALSANLLSGSIPPHLGLQQPNMTTLQLSGNFLTGTLPPGIFNATKLAVFAAVSNCLEGSIPKSICLSNRTLQTFSIDGFHAADACRIPIFPLMPETSTYKIGSGLVGNIPRCLFEDFQILKTLHVSGNAMEGKLPDLQRISPQLNNLALSHNQLSGTIPPLLLKHPQWINLDLSFNKFSGALPQDMYNFSKRSEDATIPSLRLSINRISGPIPSSLLQIENISILAGNVFTCGGGDRSLLPQNDPELLTYLCGSDQVNQTMSTFTAVVMSFLVCCAALRLLYQHAQATDLGYFEFVKTLSSTLETCILYGQIHSWQLILTAGIIRSPGQSKISQNVPIIEDTKRDSTGEIIPTGPKTDIDDPTADLVKYDKIANFFKVSCLLKIWLMRLFYILFLVVLPAEITLSFYYSTIENPYVFVTSAAFLRGAWPAIILLCIVTITLVLIFSKWLAFTGITTIDWLYWVSGINVFRLATQINGRSIAETDEQHFWDYLKLEVFTIRLSKMKLRFIAFFLFNLTVVFAVNMTYVYLTSTAYQKVFYSEKQIVAIAVSLFKLLWQFVVKRAFRSLLWSNGDDSQSDAKSMQNQEKIFFYLFLMMSVFNNIIAPYLAVVWLSPNCLYYAVVPSEPITSSYSYTWAASNKVTTVLLTAIGTFSFHSPYIYTYQCSSTMSTEFTAVFIYRFLFGSWVVPITMMLLKYIHSGISKYLRKQPAGIYSRFNHSLIVLQFILYDWVLPKAFQPCYNYQENHCTMIQRQRYALYEYVSCFLCCSCDCGCCFCVNRRCSMNPSEIQVVHDNENDRIESDANFRKMFLKPTTPILDMHMLSATLVTDVLIVLTFGTVFPLLGFVGILSIIASLVYVQCLIGRFLHWETRMRNEKEKVNEQRNALRRELLEKVNGECEHFPTLWLHALLFPLWQGLAFWFWAFFLFDMHADAKGSSGSLWIIWLMLLGLPATIVLANQATVRTLRKTSRQSTMQQNMDMELTTIVTNKIREEA